MHVLAVAMRGYEDAHGRLPPAVVYGRDGKPLLSWRVLLLPDVGPAGLYERFKLDEPWDSPHNIALLPEMPGVYAPPPGKVSKVPPYHTVCHVFVGKGTAFEDPQGARLAHNFPHHSWDPLMIVEAGPPVPWTKPEELVYDPNGQLPDLACLFRNGFRAATVNCSVSFISNDTSEAELREAIAPKDQDVKRNEVKRENWYH